MQEELKIDITNLTKHHIDKKYFQKIGESVLEELKVPENTEISLVFVGDKRMRRLNKKYRGENRATDVLSFPAHGGNFGFIEPAGSGKFLGEIVICVPQAKRQAREQSYPLKRELTMLFVHGILHLAGYDDSTQRAYNRMLKKQNEILRSLIKR